MLKFRKHVAIVEVHNIERKENHVEIEMEFCKGGSLMANIRHSPDYYSEAWIWFLIKRLSEGLVFIHGCNIIHRDISPKNILLTEDGIAVLFLLTCVR